LGILGVRGDVDVEESVEPQGENGRGRGSAVTIEEGEGWGETGLLVVPAIEGYIPGDGDDASTPLRGDLDLVFILNILNKGVPGELEWDLEWCAPATMTVPAAVGFACELKSDGEATRREGEDAGQAILL
jgi:hypothetical protein